MTAWDHTRAEAGAGPCAYLYVKHGEPRHDLVCPNEPGFTVKLREHQDRKARMACYDHLADVIWAMQHDYGGYTGHLMLTAAPSDRQDGEVTEQGSTDEPARGDVQAPPHSASDTQG